MNLTALATGYDWYEFGVRQERYPAIDWMRIVAASLVFVFHWTGEKAGSFTWGWLGVEWFFMISGFLLVSGMEGRTRLQFVGARFRRLWPTFIICLGLTALTNPVTLVQFFGNSTMLPALLGVTYADDVYWSLMFEILFYAAVCLIATDRERVAQFVLGWLCLTLLPVVAPFSTLLVFNYLAFFAMGVFLRVGNRKSFALATIMGMYLILRDHGAEFLPWFVPIALIFYYGAQVRSVPLPKIAVFLGGVSYPLYLLHNNFGEAIGGVPGIFAAIGASIAVYLFDRYIIPIKWPRYPEAQAAP